MEKPTKIQVTVGFEEIPQKTVAILRNKVLREVGFVAIVLQQIAGKTEPLPPDDLVFAVDQARRLLFNADLYLQDAQDMINGYVTHKAQIDLAALEGLQKGLAHETDHVTQVKEPVVEKNDDKENETDQEPPKSKK